MNDPYEPAEDSYFLQKYVPRYATGRVLDMGAGSGIIALTAVQRPEVREVVAVDINEQAVCQLQERVRIERIRKLVVLHSDLFQQVQGHFNIIFFNPPYLPQDKGIEDTALYGGKKGWELINRFCDEVMLHLFPEGKIILLFSSLTDRKKVEEIFAHRLFEFRCLEEQKVAFESLYVYEITRSALLRELERRGIQGATYFAKGKRGLVYKGIADRTVLVKSHFPSKKLSFVAIKAERAESGAQNRAAAEAQWLQELNKLGIGPRFLFSGERYVVYEFVDGIPLEEWLPTADKKEIINVILDVVAQCFAMDQAGVTKEEMHHPFKHILVTDRGKAVLIDFERSARTEKPKNVTQFLEYVIRLQQELGAKDIIVPKEQLRSIAKEYKKSSNPFIVNDVAKALAMGGQ